VSSWNSKKFSRDGATQTLVSLAADSALLLLQESLRDGAAASAHGSRLFAAGFGRRAWQSGVEIRSTVAPIARCALTFREPWLRTPKAVAVATYALPDGDTLLVVNLHAINFTMTFGRGSYRAQFTALGRLLDAHRGPAIVGGDFNDWNPWRGGTLQRFAGRHGLQVVAIRPTGAAAIPCAPWMRSTCAACAPWTGRRFPPPPRIITRCAYSSVSFLERRHVAPLQPPHES
jgi:endonuclease/exonuclease/phosphatase family metal-dependent hydrolase